MYIKSIVLDGFKSYGRRTEINGFDKQFNAITGLNGSGKSNILDAICFVLGISNLKQVRATQLQELVYKFGQTGVTKASVTIVFDNTDKENSPVGYTDGDEITVTRQVVMGGKNKYLINGVNAPNDRVKTLFCSVKLNVNNPNFLVMQGRIMKVLNMKPLEILSLIEEAAGTRLYETRKQTAQKTLIKKDTKLSEIDDTIRDQIKPKLETLRDERTQFLDYVKAERELEHYQRLETTQTCLRLDKNSRILTERSNALHTIIEEKNASVADYAVAITNIEIKLQELLETRNREDNQKVKAAEIIWQNSKVERDAKDSEFQRKTSEIKNRTKQLIDLELKIRSDDVSLTQKKAEFAQLNDQINELINAEETDKVNAENARLKLEGIRTGTDTDVGESALLNQMNQAELALSKAERDLRESNEQLTISETDLKKKKIAMKKTEADYKIHHNRLLALQGEVATLEEKLNQLNYREGTANALMQEQHQLTQKIRELKDKIFAVESKDSRLGFHYTDPEPNFDRRTVHGQVCRLFEVKDPKYLAAVEKVAGGRLFNVIVDNEIICKKILNKGLERRVTLIPLNKIQGRKIPQHTEYAAKQLVGPDNVWPAMSLIKYDPKYETAMAFIFGTTFICSNIQVAKTVCYNKDIMTKCITLDADTFDPTGAFGGGSSSSGNLLLAKVNDLRKYEESVKEMELRLQKIKYDLQNVTKVEKVYTELQQSLNRKRLDLGLVQRELELNAHYQMQRDVENLEGEIAQLREIIANSNNVIIQQRSKIREIQDNIQNADGNRKRKEAEARKAYKTLSDKAQKSAQVRENRRSELRTMELEIEEENNSLQLNKKQAEHHRQTLVKLEREKVPIESELRMLQEAVNVALAELDRVKLIISKTNKDLEAANKEKSRLIKKSEEMKVEIKQLKTDQEKHETDVQNCVRAITELHKANHWLKDHLDYIAKNKIVVDNQAYNPQENKVIMEQLKGVIKRLELNLNRDAANQLAATEEQYTNLLEKRQQIEDDKQNILAVIQELDEKKQLAVNVAWVQVNKDFGAIFTSLLPGAKAKLVPVRAEDFLCGLEFRVGFGDHWKESLSELSGGQRSLVALSLILSMLLFKPAPIYILDEVDAALDLSHTQNIGNMLKAHFKTSQFIIVSLKDGMFNNANVLFRTKFVDGMSAVGRTVQNRDRVN